MSYVFSLMTCILYTMKKIISMTRLDGRIILRGVNAFSTYRISGKSSQQQKIQSTPPDLSEKEMLEGCRMGIDTHADSSCAGKHVRIIEFIDGKKYKVTPFHEDYEPINNIGMINGIVAVDNEDGSGYILELNNFLNFTDTMEHTILVPMQARENGVIIDDVPSRLCPYNKSTQSIYFPEENSRIPIEFHGPIPFIRIRYPTDADMDSYQWITLTSNSDWEPYPDTSLVSDINYQFDKLYHPEITLYDKAYESVNVSSIRRKGKSNELTAEMLSRMWNISLRAAKRTLSSTTHTSIRSNEGHLARRYRTNVYQKRYRVLGGDFSRFYTDTIFFKVKSLDQQSCGQIYANKAGYTKLYFMKTKSQAHETLTTFVHEVGIPKQLHSDNAPELTKGEMKKKMNKYEIYNTQTEPHTPKQNYAEDSIRIIKSWARHFMQLTDTPIRLFSYALVYACKLRNLTVSNNVSTEGRTPFEIVHGNSPDISEYTTFLWYQIIWYWNPNDVQKQHLGRWLGVSNHIGSGHTYYVLTAKGEVIARSTVTSLRIEELNSERIKESIRKFDNNINHILSEEGGAKLDNTDFVMDDISFTTMDSDTIIFQEVLANESKDIFEMPEADEDEYNECLSEELKDLYIGTELSLTIGDELQRAKVVSRKRTLDGKMLVGKSHRNPILDSRIYKVQFEDGRIGEYTANMIAESIYANIDEEGRSHSILDGIIGHRKSEDAVSKEDGFTVVNNIKKRVVTTKGWDLLVTWRDGSRSWIELKDLKESHPVDVAEYAMSRNLENYPAFAWWVPTVLKRREKIISKLKTLRRAHKNIKFGIEIPTSLKQARELDKSNGNSLWENAINKELDKVRVAFKLLENNDPVPVGSKLINYHFVFDVKMDLSRKARLVAGGHLNKDVPRHTTYSSVVSRETVRLCFMIAAMHNLDVLAGDVGNAYLNAKPREKCHVILNDEWMFGPSAVGKIALIVRALYGMKSSGAAWRDAISSTLHYHMGFTQCLADNDLWFKEDYCDDLGRYYTYLCIYVDDILIISRNPNRYMKKMQEAYYIKPESIQAPDRYLGADIRKKISPNGKCIWITGTNSYLKEAIRVVKSESPKYYFKVTGNGSQPFSNVQYRPELDVSQMCTAVETNFFQHLIGMLRWLVELGRVDILIETSMLSSFLAAPRKGHVSQALHIFQYLEKHKNSWLAMDPEKLDIEWNGAPEQSPNMRRNMMIKIYRDAKEDIPANSPEPLGKSVQINAYSDADHAGNKVTRRSQTGILIYVNMAPISWFSKKQNTVESSTFGSEFIALRITIEKVKSLRYKLRMMGLKLDGPANIFVDNESVVNSSMRPESVLKKKHVSIAYHLARESFAASIVNIFGVRSEDNLSDAFTKVLPYSKRKNIFDAIFW